MTHEEMLEEAARREATNEEFIHPSLKQTLGPNNTIEKNIP